MIYKVLAIEYHPSGLGSSYNCTITDQKQSNITTTMANARVYLYDIVNANNTSVNNNNTVTISVSRNSGNMGIARYTYITNNSSTSKALSNVSSTNFTITNLRDPGAKIIFYGSGTGNITTTGVNKSTTVAGGRTFTIKASYSVSVSTFSYPNDNNVTVTVTPTYTGSGEGLEASNLWIHYWNVKFNGISSGNYSISGNGNHGAGSFTFKCPYDTNWTISPPKIEVYCSAIQAEYSYNAGGHIVTTEYFHVNDYYGGGVTGEKILPDGTFIEWVFVYEGNYTVYQNNGGSVIINYGLDLVRVNSSYGYTYEESHEEGGTTYSGYIEYP